MNTETAAGSAVLLFGRDGAWWDFWMVISVGAVALAGVFVLLFTAGSVMVHKREAASAGAALEQYQLETAGKVAEAESKGIAAGEEAGDAKARAAEANARAASANERAAALEVEANRLQLALAKVRDSLVERHVTDHQKRVLIRSLSGRDVSVFLIVLTTDKEAHEFRNEIAAALTEAKVKVAVIDSAQVFRKDINQAPSGTNIYGDDPSKAFLEQAFKAAGILFDTEGLPPSTFVAPGCAFISIGPRALKR